MSTRTNSTQPRTVKSAPRRKPNRATTLLTRRDLEHIVDELACAVAPPDVEGLLHKEKQLRAQIAELDDELKWLGRQLSLLLDCLRDFHTKRCPQIPFSTVALSAAAILYFANEVDLVPDFLPRLGKLDDAAVVTVAMERARKGLERYCTATGRQLADYLPPTKGRRRIRVC